MNLFELFGRKQQLRPSRRNQSKSLSLETLESRLTPTITVANGALRVVGTGGQDVIVAELIPNRVDDIRVTVYDRLTGAIRERSGVLDPEDDRFTRIELEGGSGNDILINWTANNAILRGQDGADVLQGGFGQDTLFGGSDGDHYFYSRSPFSFLPTGVVVNDSVPSMGDQLGTDTFSAVLGERNGGDVVDFTGIGMGVTFDLALLNTTQVVAPGRLSVNLANIGGLQHVIGTPFDDVLRGNANVNLLVGDAGNDTLEGRGGDDFLFGQAGGDTYVFGTGVLGHDQIQESPTGAGDQPDVLDLSRLDAGANVDMNLIGIRRTIATGILDITYNEIRSPGSSNRSNGIENVIGTRFRDLLFGNELNNRLEGGRGDDTLFGEGGRDTLLGGQGSDNLFGGNDDDELYGFLPVTRGVGEVANDTLDGGQGTDRNETWVVVFGRVVRRIWTN